MPRKPKSEPVERPREVPFVEVQVPDDDGGHEARKGRDLDTVLRIVLFRLRDELGYTSWNEAAEKWGLSLSTLTDFLRGKSMRMSTLSKLCAGTEKRPVELFRYYPEYRPEAKSDTEFAEDMVFNAFRTVLDYRQGRRLLRIIDVLRDRQALEAQLEVLEKSLGLPSPEPPHDPQEAGVTHRLDEARARRRK